ncbi:MAG: efflux RND transporter permease subunit [Acidaminococcaceae bacterium]|jgi:HAE1 family hydrophobic/amphiphilic exporter-1|nr:efflux RND transporter permease subunit [Acidaminococcaceae bacterium]
MGIIDTSLKKPVAVIICTLAISLFGYYVYKGMPRQKRPDTDFPMVTIVTTMSGANATVMDNDVADVLEDQLNGISGVTSLRSWSYPGRTVTLVEFTMDTNVNDAASDVRDKVAAAEKDLPDDADTPIVSKLDLTTSSVIQLAVTGDATEKEKSYYVDKILKPKLQSVSNVGSIETAGYRDREIRIWVKPETLHARGLVMDDIATAVNQKHVELPAGSIISGENDVDLRVNAEYASVDELKSLPIFTKDGSVVRLGEIATVSDGFAEVESLALDNEQPTTIVSVKKQSGANEVELCNNIIKTIEQLKKNMPDNIKLTVLYNQADFVKRSLDGAASDAISAVILCSILMFIFLQTFRATFVTVIAIPVCLLGSFIFMRKLGITLNGVSMMGISLSVGMVVDATTVVLENVDRHLHEGDNSMLAASKGAQEVAFSVIGGVLTTVVVFSPIAFMSGVVGRFFRSFGMTVILTISLSLVLSMTVAPFLCSRILKLTKLSKVGEFFNKQFGVMEQFYRKVLTRAVYHRRTTMLIAVGLFVTGVIFAKLLGSSFIPNSDEGYFKISCEMPSGTSIEETTRTLQDMSAMIKENPYVDYTFAAIGNNVGREKDQGTIYVSLIPRGKRPRYDVIQDQLRTKTDQFKDVKSTYATFAGKDVTMTLTGPSVEELVPLANRMVDKAMATGNFLDMDTDVRLTKPEYDVKLDRGMTDQMNVNVRALSTELYSVFGGKKIGVYKDNGYRYDIRMMASENERNDLSALDKVYAKNARGDILQAKNMFNVEKTQGPNVVKRYDRQRCVTLTANVTKDYSSGEAMTYLTNLLKEEAPGESEINIIPTGLSKYMVDDFKSLGISCIIAICLVYVVMAVQFESFLHPFVVMFSLPLLTPGAFGLLYLTGCKLDILSYMGLILLVGIVVNNGIILVDFINQERAKGIDTVQAVINAGPMRLRAILITALSTLLGAVPAALKLTEGSDMRQSMSITIFGGLFTSTFLTLLVIPVVYLIVDDLKDKAINKYHEIAEKIKAKYIYTGRRQNQHD